jgi:hypothetical protein
MPKLDALCGAFLVVVGACKDNPSGAVKAREESDLAEAQAAVSAVVSEAAQALAAASAARPRTPNDERLGLGAMPDNYLKTSDVKSADKGGPHPSLQLVSLTLSNTSHFSVGDLRGEITWTDARGAGLGSATFSLQGSVSAGETKTFSAQAGSLASPGVVEGVAAQSSVSFTHVNILN